MAVGSVTETLYEIGNVKVLKMAVTANSSDGLLADHAVTSSLPQSGFRVIKLVTNPGSTKPDDNYDITLKDSLGIDILQGLGVNRDETNTEETPIVYSGTSLHPVVAGYETLTLGFSGSTKNSATFDAYVTFALGV